MRDLKGKKNLGRGSLCPLTMHSAKGLVRKHIIQTSAPFWICLCDKFMSPISFSLSPKLSFSQSEHLAYIHQGFWITLSLAAVLCVMWIVQFWITKSLGSHRHTLLASTLCECLEKPGAEASWVIWGIWVISWLSCYIMLYQEFSIFPPGSSGSSWSSCYHLRRLRKTQVNSAWKIMLWVQGNPWKALGTQPKLLRSWTCCASLSTWLHSTSGTLYHPPEAVALRMQEFERQGVVGKWCKFPRIWWLNIIFPIQYYSVILKLPFWILLGYPLILGKPWQAHIRHIQKHGKLGPSCVFRWRPAADLSAVAWISRRNLDAGSFP